MLDPKYAFISAYLKGAEPGIVGSGHIGKMSVAPDVASALLAIRDTDIGGYLEERRINAFDDVDRFLWEYFTQCIGEVEAFRSLPGDLLKISRAYVVKYDVLNIKAILRGLSANKKARVVPVGVIHNSGLLDGLLDVGSVEEIIQLLIDCELGNFAQVLKEYNVEGDAREQFIFEAMLDSEYFKDTLRMAQRVKDGSALIKALGVCIDLTNLQIIARTIVEGMGTGVTEYMIEGGYLLSREDLVELVNLKFNDLPRKLEGTQYHEAASELLATYDSNKSVTAVEEVIGKHKFRLLRDLLAPRTLSPLVMAWYLIVKESEMRNLRLILKAKFDGVSVEKISGYLVL